MAVNYGSKPFPEAINYLRDKVNVPTQAWTELWEGQHARAFTVAGATKEELLTDLRQAVAAAVEDGETLAQFRDRFDDIVQRHGWAYNGGRNWRTRVIYRENIRSAYNAGRYKQQQAIKHRRPYLQYKHSDRVRNPRPEHLAWNGKIWHIDDPIWDLIYPQNGWGCQCSTRSLSDRDLKRLGMDGPDEPPELEFEERTVGIRGPFPRTVRVPKGVDPGWAYHVGKAASGQRLAREAMDNWAKTAGTWQRLVQSGYAEAGRPSRLPAIAPPVSLGAPLETATEIVDALEQQLGGPSKSYRVGGLPVEINARALGEHLDPRRAEYLPLLDDAITRPQEVWMNWERHQGTGEVRVMARIIKTYDIGRDRTLVVVTKASGGLLVSHTLFPTRDHKYVNRQRQGKLMYSDDEAGDEE